MSSNKTKEIILFFWDKKENTILTNSGKSAHKCVLQAKFYYQTSRNDNTEKKSAYQTDTQIIFFYEKIRFLQFSLRHMTCWEKIFFTRQEKKENKNIYTSFQF